jgi:hypothetical protein
VVVRRRGAHMDENRRTYREKLLEPRWQRVRLRVFARDGWSCVACQGTTRTLHVHHLLYEAGKEPWESHPNTLATLCEVCHLLVSPAGAAGLKAKFGLTAVELWEAAGRVKESLGKWLNRLREFAETAHAGAATAEFVSTCPNWRKLRPRAGRVWTPDEDEALLLEFDAGLPLEQIALSRGRGIFGVAVRLCKLGRTPPDSGRGRATR